ncbi:hypothetical protein GCM10010472_61140 [Pseudonocardia halophobica]|uniref:Uncharacterized protein n=1 Tax=Pseudonocardia halophobica TaxID=29401 RepID=A0A9W6L6X1_9PSEU|nr:hypothetical protein [Pseudonocardia halophobica]GLL14208.1 hypothetical protein GCM10017577_53550 [Pseudonocardia halophobica]
MAKRDSRAKQASEPAPVADVPYYRALFGALGWGVVAFALQVVFGGTGGATGLLIQVGWILIAAVLAAWPTWYAARRRGWPELWKLFLLAAPAFWVLRAVTLILDRLLFH